MPANLVANPTIDHVPPRQISKATFQINNAKLYVPLVTSSFFGNINQSFIRTISWNKFRSEITTRPRNNNLDYMIDPTFRNINRLFVF